MSNRPSTVQSAPANASDQSEHTVESEPSFSPLHDTSFSSITDIFEGTKTLEIVYELFFFVIEFKIKFTSELYIEKSSDEVEMRSFHKLSDAGLVRRRTRNFEARLRRTKPRKKVYLKNPTIFKFLFFQRNEIKTCQSELSAGSEVTVPFQRASNSHRTRLLSGNIIIFNKFTYFKSASYKLLRFEIDTVSTRRPIVRTEIRHPVRGRTFQFD